MLSLNSDRYLEYFFAVPWTGGVFVPINTRLAPPEVVHWVNDSGATVLLIDANFSAMLPKIQNQLVLLVIKCYRNVRFRMNSDEKRF